MKDNFFWRLMGRADLIVVMLFIFMFSFAGVVLFAKLEKLDTKLNTIDGHILGNREIMSIQSEYRSAID